MTVVRVYDDETNPPDFTKLTPVGIIGPGVVQGSTLDLFTLNQVAGAVTHGQEIVSGTSFLDYVYRGYSDWDLDVIKAFFDQFRALDGVSILDTYVRTPVADWDALYDVYGISYP